MKLSNVLVVALVFALLFVSFGGIASAQNCAPKVQAAPQYQQQTYAAPVVQAQVVAVPSYLFVVPSAPTVQLQAAPQYQYVQPMQAPQYVPQAQAAPVVVQKQVVVKQAAPVTKVVVQQAPQRRGLLGRILGR